MFIYVRVFRCLEGLGVGRHHCSGVGLLGTGAQDGHLDFHAAPDLCNSSLLLEYFFTSTETVGLLGTGAQDGHFAFLTAPEL